MMMIVVAMMVVVMVVVMMMIREGNKDMCLTITNQLNVLVRNWGECRKALIWSDC